ncbi:MULTISPECIES: DUF7144 family membrane protein [Nocardia]|uniref:DUF7144 family membrane protein n=1 Tax=Nocardia TaxID=1817 RepID=UPI000D69BE7B|nr:MULTISPECIES: hypothetical protein [Nocardia]
MTYASDLEPPAGAGHPLRQRIVEGTSLATAILLFTAAMLSFFEGLSALLDDEFYGAGVEYIYKFDATSWGWIHIALGAVLALCSIGLLTGTMWGRYAAICLAVLSIIMNFLALPRYPAWSILVIAIDIVVVWAIAAWRPAPLRPATGATELREA